jgi:hypothetical protein
MITHLLFPSSSLTSQPLHLAFALIILLKKHHACCSACNHFSVLSLLDLSSTISFADHNILKHFPPASVDKTASFISPYLFSCPFSVFTFHWILELPKPSPDPFLHLLLNVSWALVAQACNSSYSGGGDQFRVSSDK